MEAKKFKLIWRGFTFSSIVLIAVSIVAVSRPLGDSMLDQVSLILPFLSLYYIIFGLHKLGKIEEKMKSAEKKD